MKHRNRVFSSLLVCAVMLAALAMPSTAFAADEPGTPASVAAVAGANKGEITLTINAPADAGDNGATISHYNIEIYTGGSKLGAELPQHTGAVTTHTIKGLSDGTAYDFRVYAVNSLNFTSAAYASTSATTLPATPPGPVLPGEPGLTLSAGNGYILVTVTEPSNASGAGTLTYNITVKNGSTVVYANDVTLPGGYWVTGLTNGTTYTVEVYAKNSAGSGPKATKQAKPATASQTAPGTPGVTLTAGSGYIDVYITKPSDIGSGATSVTYYITVRQSGSVYNHSTASTGTYRVTGLMTGAPATVEVYARNNLNLNSAVITQTITPYASATYGILSQTAIYTGSGSAFIVVDAPSGTFSTLRVNGYALTRNTHYGVESDSNGKTRLTLYPAYLNSLANGIHNISIAFTGGTASTTLQVAKSVLPTLPPAPTPTPPTSGMGNFIVTAGTLNVRSAASTSAAIVGRLTKNTLVTVEQTVSNWGKITMTNGLSGWVSMSYMRASSSGSSGGSSTAIGAYITTGNVHMRTGPGTNFKSVGVLSRGMRINVISFTGNWAYVTTGSRNVYVSRTYLTIYR